MDVITYPCWDFHPKLYNGCNYLSILGLKLNDVSKRGSRKQKYIRVLSILHTETFQVIEDQVARTSAAVKLT